MFLVKKYTFMQLYYFKYTLLLTKEEWIIFCKENLIFFTEICISNT